MPQAMVYPIARLLLQQAQLGLGVGCGDGCGGDGGAGGGGLVIGAKT